MKIHIKIMCYVVLMGISFSLNADQIQQFFNIFPGTNTYQIAISCPLDTTTSEHYHVFPIPPFGQEITNIGEVYYDPQTGKATVSITATETTTMLWGTDDDGCILTPNDALAP